MVTKRILFIVWVASTTLLTGVIGFCLPHRYLTVNTIEGDYQKEDN